MNLYQFGRNIKREINREIICEYMHCLSMNISIYFMTFIRGQQTKSYIHSIP